MPINDSFHIYDTTLRDGAQQEGLNLSDMKLSEMDVFWEKAKQTYLNV